MKTSSSGTTFGSEKSDVESIWLHTWAMRVTPLRTGGGRRSPLEDGSTSDLRVAVVGCARHPHVHHWTDADPRVEAEEEGGRERAEGRHSARRRDPRPTAAGAAAVVATHSPRP